ncbi:hypothetical protein GOB94_01415 [Granulicella sp. 5B5]|uniref:FliM/FliN family flagellar motor switch protein n=1 Tax=Granulicella sp. 5B5 TaxID=1617967 RepID=UPI0015F5A710|nr:FliM/FliN family flagellar motor switch protein [Granulicella sp. 5B5]QMV17514.1 hypothetical protein GOB94_01415 [Granulicella sp. 5B5]
MNPNAPIIEPPAGKRPKPKPENRDVRSCNFRYAGRLSNDSARSLSNLFDKFAFNASIAFEAYLGASFRLKLTSMNQSTIQEYLEGIGLDSYLVPCALTVMDAHLLMQTDLPLALPIIDLLLGGGGEPLPGPRELTDLDEEILGNASLLFVKEIERIWRPLNLSYQLLPCVRPASVAPLFAANEKVAVLLFELEVGTVRGNFRLVLPTSFVGYLVRHLNTSHALPPDDRHDLRIPTLRLRMLNCHFTLSADITEMHVRIRDLVELAPGQVIKMRAPVREAGCLTVEDREIFKANPVRSGSLKAAQILSTMKDDLADVQ